MFSPDKVSRYVQLLQAAQEKLSFLILPACARVHKSKPQQLGGRTSKCSGYYSRNTDVTRLIYFCH